MLYVCRMSYVLFVFSYCSYVVLIILNGLYCVVVSYLVYYCCVCSFFFKLFYIFYGIIIVWLFCKHKNKFACPNHNQYLVWAEGCGGWANNTKRLTQNAHGESCERTLRDLAGDAGSQHKLSCPCSIRERLNKYLRQYIKYVPYLFKVVIFVLIVSYYVLIF